MIDEKHVCDDKKDLIDFLIDLAMSEKYVFRGYSLQEQLLPSIIRNKAIAIENELLFEFERYASQYINVANPVDLMSYAQHFGLSTRLIDFTHNPFIALYFALFKDKSPNTKIANDSIYYYLRYASIHDNDYRQELHAPVLIGQVSGTISNSWAQKAINCINEAEDNYKSKKEKVILFVDPNQSNQRLIMQQGLFMVPYTLDEQEHKQVIYNNTSVICVHKKLRSELRDYLDTIGINAFRLMPDLTNVCQAVERNIKEGRYHKRVF